MSTHPDPTKPEFVWHLDKKVPISMIVTIVLMCVSGISVLINLKKDVDTIKLELSALHARDERNSADLRDAIKLMQETFQRLDNKLDRLIERKL